MHSVRNLRHLDLSSNQIVTMEGLTGLTHLRTLNLSCNLIEVVQGLRNLRYKLYPSDQCKFFVNSRMVWSGMVRSIEFTESFKIIL